MGVNGRYSVAINGDHNWGREEVWMRSVGSYLRALHPPASRDSAIFQEYEAAGVGTRLASGVARQLKRSRDGRSGTCSFSTSFEPDVPEVKRARVDTHARREHCRAFKAAIEGHWRDVDVLLGTLFHSQRDFRLANLIMSRESASTRNLAGHSRRRRLQFLLGVSYPCFSNIRNWISKLITACALFFQEE